MLVEVDCDVSVEVKIDNMPIVSARTPPTTAATLYHFSVVVQESASKEGFVGFLQILLLRWTIECSWRSTEARLADISQRAHVVAACQESTSNAF